jgi:hypothetical protein
MDRLQEKHALLVKLGCLFGPLQRLIEFPEQYDQQERAEVLARFFAEYSGLIQSFSDFARGQPGHLYVAETIHFNTALHTVVQHLSDGVPLEDVVKKHLPLAQKAICDVPVPRTSVILEAGSPFTAYCKLLELCEADTTTSLAWLDAYYGPEVFHRYLRAVRPSAPITLVTQEPGPHAGKPNLARWSEFLDVSRLFATERGPSSYRLVIQPTLHDRWIVFDDKRIYSLGNSAKDAANKDYFTLTAVEPSESNLAKIAALTSGGAEWFGPSCPTHH